MQDRGLLFIGGFPLGYIIYALMAMATRNWRRLAQTGTFFGFLSFVLACFLQESPKWLIERGKIESAIRSLKQIAKWNKIDFDEELIRRSLLQKRQVHPAGNAKTYTYLHLFRNRESTKRILLSMYTYSMTVLVYYGLLYNIGKNFISKKSQKLH